MKNSTDGPKILIVDIETLPLEVRTWGIYDQNIGLNQIKKDWAIMAWAAKWLNEPTVYYQDQRKAKDARDDKKLLGALWKLMDEADIIIAQNGIRFDIPKLNTRFLINKMGLPSSYKVIDTRVIASKKFGFTSNSLAYLTKVLDTKHKKLEHKKYPGQELWTECEEGNLDAWREMEKYNKHDVLALEDVYNLLVPYNTNINFAVYYADTTYRCQCGSKDAIKNGFFFTSVGKYQRYRCKKCGSESRDRKNLISKDKSKSLKVKVPR